MTQNANQIAPAAPETTQTTAPQTTQEGTPYQASQEAAGSTQVVLDRPDHIAPAALSEGRMEALLSEVSENGDVGPATYKKMSGYGLSKTDVDRIVEGEKARLNQVYGRVADAVGGAEGMAAIKEWAANLPPAELKEVNQALAATKRDPVALELVWRGLQARQASSGQSSTAGLAKGTVAGPASTGAAPFGNQTEMRAAMNDMRYRTDETYRNQVIARLARTPDQIING